jgi:hypothetical protein
MHLTPDDTLTNLFTSLPAHAVALIQPRRHEMSGWFSSLGDYS